jgi:hypothetical protein
MSTPAGWYPDPVDQRMQRFWTGSAWTAQRIWTGSGWADAAPARPTAASKLATAPPKRRSSEAGRRLASILALLCAMGVAAIAIVMAVHPGAAPPAATRLSSQFEMHFDNLTYHIQTDGTLTHVIQQARGRISGTMTVDAPLYGTGRVTGTRDGSTIHFAGAQNGTYQGTLTADGQVRGTYTYPGQHGEWRAIPTRPVTTSKPAWPPWWLWLLLAAAAVGLVASGAWALTSTRQTRPV